MTARDWRSRAACLGEDPELFFPVVEEGPLCAAQVAAAKAVCARCPVRRTCLEDATERLSHGIAGGLTAEERRQAHTEQIARRRPGAPRREARVAGLALIARGVSVSIAAEHCGVSGRTVARGKARVSA